MTYQFRYNFHMSWCDFGVVLTIFVALELLFPNQDLWNRLCFAF